MLHFLIIVAFNLANPSEPALLAHKVYYDKATCEAAGAKYSGEAPKNLRIASFCVEAYDLIEQDKKPQT